MGELLKKLYKSQGSSEGDEDEEGEAGIQAADGKSPEIPGSDVTESDIEEMDSEKEGPQMPPELIAKYLKGEKKKPKKEGVIVIAAGTKKSKPLMPKKMKV